MTTFTDLLRTALATDAAQPLVTFYDHASGERVELSATTYANWVAKVAGLLADELDLERGQRLRLDLPSHWLVPVFLGAAWTVGLSVVDADAPGEPDAVVCGPDTLDSWAGRADEMAVLACALLPLGVRFREPVPPGVHDVGLEVWSQPDAFIALDPPTGEDAAVDLGGRLRTQDQLWSGAADGALVGEGGRLGTVVNPGTADGLAAFTEVLARRGSLVLVSHGDPARLAATWAAERVTSRFPGDG